MLIEQGMQRITKHGKKTASSWSLVKSCKWFYSRSYWGSTVLGVPCSAHPQGSAQSFVGLIPLPPFSQSAFKWKSSICTNHTKRSNFKTPFCLLFWSLTSWSYFKINTSYKAQSILLKYPVHLTVSTDHCKDIEASPTS